MRLVFVMECVLALAVGLGLAREARPVDFPPFLSINFTFVCLRIVHRLSVGVGLILGIGAWVEAARRRGPDAWGPGRWVLSVVAVWVLNAVAAKLATHFVLAQFNPMTRFDASYAYQSVFDDSVGGIVGAVVLTFLIARPSRRAPADAREWTGRIYAGLVIACGFANTIVGYFDSQVFLGMGIP